MTLTDLHFAVQLWEGGPYWATTNIGATSSADYGYYFAWGYTDACVRNSADDGWVLASDGTTQKQFNASYFSNRDASTYEDAASTKWGNGWSVPTKSNLEDLINTSNTTTEWVLSGSRGMKVTGKGDYASNSIFLPSPGYGTDGQKYSVGSVGHYWSSEINSYGFAFYLSYNPGNANPPQVQNQYRYHGKSIRPVRSSL